MSNQLKICMEIYKAIASEKYKDLGLVKLQENDNTSIIIIKVIPYEGFHKNKEYVITLNLKESNNWPIVHIDSEIFDKIKTRQYLQNKGRNGEHKGICIKDLSWCYDFNKNFKDKCGNKWENYLYNLIIVFNNFKEDFVGGNGIVSGFNELLENKT